MMARVVNVVISKAVDQIPYIGPHMDPEGSKKENQSFSDNSLLARWLVARCA